MKEIIQKLVETPGPSGHEDRVRALVRAEIEAHADEIHVDALGNLIAKKGAKDSSAPVLLLAAHMDEIGVMVTHVDENGFVRFTSIGAVYPKNCIGNRVIFLNGTRGVINTELMTTRDKVPGLDRMYIDVGATRRDGCPVGLGDVAAFDYPFLELGDRLVAKAMDDRIGVAILIETLRQLKETRYQVYFVFSVQEEVGLRGSTTAAYGIDPDLGLAIDVTTVGDTPKGVKMEMKLGQGPGIKIRDQGMLSDPHIVDWMVRTAERQRLPHQLEVLLAGTTDARAMQITRAGVPSGALSIPCRYIHSTSEMVDYSDVRNAVQLLLAMLQELWVDQ